MFVLVTMFNIMVRCTMIPMHSMNIMRLPLVI